MSFCTSVSLCLIYMYVFFLNLFLSIVFILFMLVLYIPIDFLQSSINFLHDNDNFGVLVIHILFIFYTLYLLLISNVPFLIFVQISFLNVVSKSYFLFICSNFSYSSGSRTGQVNSALAGKLKNAILGVRSTLVARQGEVVLDTFLPNLKLGTR